MMGMEEERLEELFRDYRNCEISKEEWVEKTMPRERMWAVMRYDEPDEEQMLIIEQLAIALEISDRATAPDEVEPVDPEDMNSPDDIDLSNNSDESK